MRGIERSLVYDEHPKIKNFLQTCDVGGIIKRVGNKGVPLLFRREKWMSRDKQRDKVRDV